MMDYDVILAEVLAISSRRPVSHCVGASQRRRAKGSPAEYIPTLLDIGVLTP
jgi:hypothetical protein